jgi:hypothetical protein
MIIDNLDQFGAAFAPYKADPPLIVDTDTMLAAATTRERLEPIPRWHAQIREPGSRIEHIELAHCNRLDGLKFRYGLAPVQRFGALILE